MLFRVFSFVFLVFFCSQQAMAVLAVDVPFVVTASRHAQTADDVLVPVVVISREDIEQSSAKDVAELLQFHAGLDIARNGGDGTTTSLFLRGTNSSHVLVLVDGVKINSASAGGAAFQYLDPDMIERIEVVKGPRSSLYGSEALGGVVQIFTRKSRSGLSVKAMSGSLNSSKLGFNAGFDQYGLDGNITFSRYKTGGYVDNASSSQKHGFENQSLQFRIGTEIAGTRVDFKHLQADGSSEYYGYHAQKFTFSELAQKNLNSVTSLDINTQVSKKWGIKVIIARSKDYLQQTVSKGHFNTDRNFVDVQNDIQLSAHNLLTLGVSSQDDKVDSDQYQASSSVQSVYLQDDWVWGAHHLIIAGRSLKNSIYGSQSTYNVDYGYALNSRLQINLSQGTGFKAPVFNELYYPFSGNPNLKPEVSLNQEWGFDYRFSANHKLKLSVFENNISELISYEPPTYKPVNVNKARINGVELGYEARLGSWVIESTLIEQNPLDLSNNKVLARRAKQSLSLLLGYSGKKLQSSLNVLATGKRQDGTTELAPYTLVNLNLSYRISRSASLSLLVDNLSNEIYQTVSGYPAKPQSFYLKLDYKL